MNRAERRALARDIAQQAGRGAVDLSQLAQQSQPKVISMFYVAGDSVKTLWHESIVACAARSSEYGFLLRPRWIETESFISRGRNLAAASFFQNDDDYFLFVDTDMVFAPQDVAQLLKADAPIAGALYFTAAAGLEPWPTALEGPNEDGDYVPVALPEPPEDFDENDPVKLGEWITGELQPRKVASVGTGFMLIKREVLLDVASAYDGRPFEFVEDRGEDVTFCLRAAELGYDTYLCPAARVGHVKSTVL